VGTGAVISPGLVVTCEHVVRGSDAAKVHAENGEFDFRVLDSDADLDVALLEPAQDGVSLPASSILIPRALRRGRRLPDDRALVELCTDEADTPRSLDVEVRPGPSDSRRIEFVVASSREGVRRGYSGGPVVEIDEHSQRPRLVGIVRARDERSVTVDLDAGRGWFVPTDRIVERFEQVAEQTETPVERDPSWEQHWEPRSRGVATASDDGFFFSGRATAYERVRDHMDQGQGLLVVTGSRGSGKSALLARVVVLGCRRYLASLGAAHGDAIGAYEPPTRPVDAAVLARGKSPDAVAMEVGEQLGFAQTTALELAATLMRERLRPSIVIDAIDESLDSSALAREVVLPLAQTGSRLAIAALRRRIAADLAHADWVDLDREPYRDDAALPDYVQRRLTAGRHYTGHSARKVATAVAKGANGIFVVAELVARTLAQRAPIDTTRPSWRAHLPTDVTEAFEVYLARFGGERRHVLALLHPLAHALAEGLTVDPGTVWLATANRLRPRELRAFTGDDLRDAHSRAQDYLIMSGDDAAVRLYHEGLADAVRRLAARERLDWAGHEITPAAIGYEIDEAAASFLDALLELLPDENAPADAYDTAEQYLLRHLPSHLTDRQRAGELLIRPGLLLAADQDSVRRALVRGAPGIPTAHQKARVAAVHALARTHASTIERAAALSAALRRQGEGRLADRLRTALPRTAASRPPEAGRLPYELISGPPYPAVLVTISDAHRGRVSALRLVEHEGEPLLLSGGRDAAIRSWRLDGSPGPLAREHAHARRVTDLALAEHEGEPLLLSGALDGAIRSWRPDGSPGPLAREQAHPHGVTALALAEHEGEQLLLSGGRDGAIHSWRLDGSPGPLEREQAHAAGVTALASAEHEGEPLLLSGGRDGAIHSWRLDGSPGPLAREHAHDNWIAALALAQHDGEPLLLSGGADGAIRSWRLDGSPGPLAREPGRKGALVLALGEIARRPILLSGGHDGAIRSWQVDESAGPLAHEQAHGLGVSALARAEHEGEPLLLSGQRNGAIRSSRLDGRAGPLAHEQAHRRGVAALARAEHEGEPLLLSGGFDGAIHSWRLDGSPGPLAKERAHARGVSALARAEHGGEPLLVSGGVEGAIHSWRLDGSPGPLACERAHARGVSALALAEHEGEPLLLSGGFEGAIRSWRLDGSLGPLACEQAHRGGVSALMLAEHEGEPLLLSGGRDWAIRSWRLNGSPGPLGNDRAHSGGVSALVLAEHEGAPLLVSGGEDRAIRSWRLDGSPGPLARERAHENSIAALALAEHDNEPLVISGGFDGLILAHRIVPG
jgi:WD40 repeat protein/S1-C subfamily serine protease